MDHKALKDRKELLVHKVHKEKKVRKVSRGLRERLE
jgi:hypothetical protein